MSADLIKPEPAGALAVPEYMGQFGGEAVGFDEMDKKDMSIPRLAICQSNSPQRKRQDAKYIEGLSDGQLFNSATKVVYGETVQVIPIRFGKSRILFTPLEEGGGMICRSRNSIIPDGGQMISPTCESCPKSKFQGDDKPECDLFNNYLLLLLPDLEPVAFSLKSAGLSAARDWNTTMKFKQQLLKNKTGKDMPMFTTGVFEIRIIPQTRNNNDFFGAVVGWKRWPSQVEADAAAEVSTAFKDKPLVAEAEAEAKAKPASKSAPIKDEDIPF